MLKFINLAKCYNLRIVTILELLHFSKNGSETVTNERTTAIICIDWLSVKVDDNDIDGTFSFPNMQILTDTLFKHIDSSIDFKLKFSNSKKRVNLVTDTEVIFLTIICEKKKLFQRFFKSLEKWWSSSLESVSVEICMFENKIVPI